MDKAIYNRALEDYLVEADMVFKKNEKERILESSNCNILCEKDHIWRTVYMILTNKGIYLMKKIVKNQCKVCPKEKFCKGGPTLLARIKLSEVTDVNTCFLP